MVKSQTGLLELDDGAFDAMLLKPGAKRSFPVLVFFTATNPKYSCQPCHMIGDALAYVAQSYALTNARKSAEHKLPPVIFAIADVDTAPQTVHEHIQLQTVPHLYLFPGNEALTLPPTEAEEMHLSPDDEGLAAFLEELEDRLGLTIPPVPDTTFTIQVAVAAALVLAVAVYLLLDQWTWVKGLPYRRGLWLTFSYCVFGTATGGMVYCVIREPPPFGVYQKKLHLFAMRQSSDQFVAEGLVMGGIQLFAGLSFVATYAFASKTRNRLVQFVGTSCFAFSTTSLPLSFFHPPIQLTHFPKHKKGVNLSLAAAFYFLHRLFGLYAEKTKWYQVNATLDPLVRLSTRYLSLLPRLSIHPPTHPPTYVCRSPSSFSAT